MRLCSYVVKYDVGLAPNPFWGYCTLAVCTPNHMGIRPQKGDWFMGTQTANRGSKLVYVMQISEVLPFEAYYLDARFEKKKPKIKGTLQESHGDNMYYRNKTGEWEQHPTCHHTKDKHKEQDLKHPYVFISEYFYYFGKKMVGIPLEYQGLIWKRQGCKCSHAPEIIKSFLNWLEQKFEPGLYGDPGDWQKSSSPIELI